MKLTRTMVCLAFAAAMLACSAGNASTQSESESPVAEAGAKDDASSNILTPKDDAQIRPGMKVARPTVIDFNATWCGPCRLFAPAFDKAAEKYGKKVDFYSIDTDKYPQTATSFSISAIPTVVFMMPDGTVQTHVGLSDFLTTLSNPDPSQEEVTSTMAAELERMAAKMLE